MEYTFTEFSEVPDLAAQAMRLQNLAFAEYEGAMAVDLPWMKWYLKRPGTDLSLCPAALAGDTLVSQVIVCIQPLQLGGALLQCGIIDSVATDPAHRRQGLARSLMERAHEGMQRTGLDAAVLYTNPEDHPYRFYERLGYEERARAAMMIGPRPGDSGHGPAPVEAGEYATALSDLTNRYHAAHEGYSPLGEDLWRWHKVEPPNPPTVVAELEGSKVVATASFAPATLSVRSSERAVSVASDLAATDMSAERMEALLSSAPADFVAVLLDDRAPERPMVEGLGLTPEVAEVSMVFPFSDAARRALEERSGPWYVMVESVVGV